MIYVDTSVVLAELMAEDRHPPAALWQESLVCSNLRSGRDCTRDGWHPVTAMLRGR